VNGEGEAEYRNNNKNNINIRDHSICGMCSKFWAEL